MAEQGRADRAAPEGEEFRLLAQNGHDGQEAVAPADLQALLDLAPEASERKEART